MRKQVPPVLCLFVLGAMLCFAWFLNSLSPSPPYHRWPLEKGASHTYNATWDQLMDLHLRRVRRADRVVLCKWSPENKEGLSNRMLHTASCLMLAMLTNRTLHLHWPGNRFIWDGEMNEYVGIDPFGAIFEPSQYLLLQQQQRGDCQYVDTEDLAVIAQLQRDDPQQLHADAPCLEIRSSWRFWGGMLAHNPHVAYGPPSTSFSTIAKRTLVPLPSNAPWTNSTAEGCEWLIQYRDRARGNGRLNPLLPAFLECGRLHGMRSITNVWFLSDQDSSGQDLLLRRAPLAYCRHEPGCDRDTVHLMRYLGSCKRVLLSDYSTFGQCLAGLSTATMREQWVVHAMPDGGSSCSRKYDLEPSWRLSDFTHSQRMDPLLAAVDSAGFKYKG